MAWVKKFEETNSLLDLKHGAPRTVHMLENLQIVENTSEHSPRRSARQQSRIFRFNTRSLHRMLQDIKYHPYKLQVVHQINERYKEVRLAFCTGLLRKNPYILNNLLTPRTRHILMFLAV